MIRAAVLSPGEPVRVREFPEPDLEPDSARLEIECSEVCGTDVHLRDGRLAGVPYPIIPGHVAVGRLAKIRGTLFDIDGKPFAEGDRITFLDVHGTCHRCWYCLVAKATTRCPKRRVYGITYGLADGFCGGWSSALYLKPGTQCIRLDGLEPELFMRGGCALPTALHAVERADIRIADHVLVLGSGPVGIACIVLARLRGAAQVDCIGGPPQRLETARAVGASTGLDFQAHGESEQLEWVLQRTHGRGADVTIEATGDPRAVRQALRCTRDAGQVIVVGQYTDRGEVTLHPHHELNRKHLDIRGCWGSDFSHFARGVRILQEPELRAVWERIPVRRYALEQLNDALGAVEHGRVLKALVDPRL